MPIPTNTASKSKAKRGRKAKDHVCSFDGKTINGLYRKPNGVWRVRATGKEFTEPDERQALARFAALTKAAKAQVRLPLAVASPEEAIEAAKTAGFNKLLMHFSPGQPAAYGVEVGSDEFYAAMRRVILEEPQLAARMTGLEWLAWGPELPSPKPSPKLATIGELYFAKIGLSSNELSRSKLFWKEFMKAVNVDSVREITHEVVAQYEKLTRDKGLAPKSILHRYRKVRSLFHHAIRRGQSPDDCRKALDVLTMLEIKGTQTLDPTPISPDQFWPIYGKAKEAGDETFAALLLLALNAAMYGGEVTALKWEEVNLDTAELVTRRPKTQVSRVATLWPETVDALRALPNQGEYLFHTRTRSYTVASVGGRFKKYRDAAGLPKELTFGTIRDASYTVACHTSIDQARMLAGHRAGIADHYLRRRPDLVTEACAAIAKAFAVGEHGAAIDKALAKKAQ